MTPKVLEALKTEEFDVEVGPALQPELLWKRLARTQQVKDLKTAIEAGGISDGDLASFVSDLTGQFGRGQRFPYEMALGAVAVAVEARGTRFAEEYLCTLAGLRLAELGVAPGIARVCLRHRSRQPTTEIRDLVLSEPDERFELCEHTEPRSSRWPRSVELFFDASP